MLHVRVGVGFSKDEENPGKKAAEMAMEKAGTDRCNFVIVFSSVHYDPEKVLEGVTSVTKDAPLFGATTAGEIDGGANEKSVVVMVIDSKYFRVGVGIGENVKENPEQAAEMACKEALFSLKEDASIRSLASFKEPWEQIRYSPYIALLTIDGLSGAEEKALEGVKKIFGTTPIIGGSSGDDLRLEKTFQFCNGKVYTNSIAVALISTDLKVGFASMHGWVPTEKTALVTKSEGRTVKELDSKPAVEVYSKMLGLDAEKLKEKGMIAFEEGLVNPLGISDITGDVWLRHPMKVNEDGSMSFFSEVPEQTVLKLAHGTKESLVKAGLEATEKCLSEIDGAPAFCIMFNCVARKALLKEAAGEEIKKVKEKLGNVPMIGFYTYGEQAATEGGALGHRNQTITMMVIADKLITQ